MRAVVLVLAALTLSPAWLVAAGTAADGPDFSSVPPGPYGGLPVEVGEFVASDGTPISHAVFRPDVPAGVLAPVIMVASPYHGDDIADPQHFYAFLVDSYVSHGYAVALVAVRGTGWSGGCNSFLSEREAEDLDEIVTHLATRAWANGRVGMIGASYDGTTPWMVAARGNPHLATVVPISGISDLEELHFDQGVAEARTPIMVGLYLSYGAGNVGGERPLDRRVTGLACPEAAPVMAAWTYGAAAEGARAPALEHEIEARKWRERVRASYDGSAFIVHGLEDFNVNPRQAMFHRDLEVETKVMLGVWGHEYPDTVAGRRDDWAALLLAWWDRHLKGLDRDTGPAIEVQDRVTREWRAAASWGETGLRTFHLDGAGALADAPVAPFDRAIATPAGLGLVCEAQASPSTAVGLAVGTLSGASPDFRRRFGEPFRVAGEPVVEIDLAAPAPARVTVRLCAGVEEVGIGAAAVPDDIVATGGTVRVVLEPTEFTVPATIPLTLSVYADAGREAQSLGVVPAAGAGVGRMTGGRLHAATG